MRGLGQKTGVRSQESECGLAAMVICAVALAACSSTKPAPLKEASTELLSDVQTADSRGALQLVHGFEQVEQRAWRWTNRTFGLVLKTPVGAARHGAGLRLEFTLPSQVLSASGPVELVAVVNGYSLGPQVYNDTGVHVYQRDVPPEALRTDAVLVEFSTGKEFRPLEESGRELALVANRVALLGHE